MEDAGCGSAVAHLTGQHRYSCASGPSVSQVRETRTRAPQCVAAGLMTAKATERPVGGQHTRLALCYLEPLSLLPNTYPLNGPEPSTVTLVSSLGSDSVIPPVPSSPNRPPKAKPWGFCRQRALQVAPSPPPSPSDPLAHSALQPSTQLYFEAVAMCPLYLPKFKATPYRLVPGVCTYINTHMHTLTDISRRAEHKGWIVLTCESTVLLLDFPLSRSRNI